MQALITSHPHTVTSIAEAEETAATLNRIDEDGWTYEVNKDPSGNDKAFIVVRDEHGNYLGGL